MFFYKNLISLKKGIYIYRFDEKFRNSNILIFTLDYQKRLLISKTWKSYYILLSLKYPYLI